MRLNELTAAAAADLIRRGETTASALAEATLSRIAERQPEIGAFAHVDPTGVMAAAEAADRRRAEGLPLGPLHGVPFAVKDVVDTLALPTEHGSRAFAGRRAEADAAVVELLEAAGAILIGKAVTCELATQVPSAVRNPHDTSRTPGGSSAGSAAAVADFQAPIALGTQTVGSVVRPASFCGVFGMKPSYGLVPRTGVLMQSDTLDHVGIFARSVEDLALAGDVLAAHDPRDPASLRRGPAGLLATATMDWPVSPTFALIRPPRRLPLDPRLTEAYGELLDHLGPRVTEIDVETAYEDGLAALDIIRIAEAARHYGPVVDRTPELVDPVIRDVVERGRAVSAVAYLAALEERRSLRRLFAAVFMDHGTILTPPALGPAPEGFASTGDPSCCGLWTFLGTPALSLPLIEADGLPIGVQLVGAHGDDGRLLRTARLLIAELAA